MAAQTLTHLPLPYTLFFLYIEPFSTIVGAIYAHFAQHTYLQLTHAPSAPILSAVPTATSIALTQLANLYLAFTLNEALVLRATRDVRVWRALLFGLLVADFGHLYSVNLKGLQVYYDVLGWNAIDWGNVAFVYCGATMRICFLLGVGLGGKSEKKRK